MKPFEKKKHLFRTYIFVFVCTLWLSAPCASAQETYPVIFEATQKAVLSAERSGVLTSLKVDAGSAVRKGAVIARVNVGDLDLQKKRSELSLRHLNVKVKNLERLLQRGLATDEELAEAKTQKDVTYTDIQIFKRQISKSQILAPFQCTVIRRHVQPHEWVTAGQPVVEVVAPGKLRAVANIPSRLAVKLEKGATHTFEVHDLEISVSGTVEAVVPEVDELSNTAQVIWNVEKSEKNLLSGMKGEVRISDSELKIETRNSKLEN
ncbi:efflux RND transporter periplasmic adaptor subunit [Desulfonema magnum]|uniref:Efflux transporter, RND family n=1 Tax=Desulfonema magnum TaxID=45655 RepID=A0A975GU37_9BACT|nr:efflux RND transporter periplasmic adaptor subunit [Desulfonema magnum]QTA93627.1 Efflux transporter, RND family [Desulfonema magnum]